MSTRVFLKEPIGAGRIAILDKAKSHHLINVMRIKIRENLQVFNENDGEWAATVLCLKPFLEIEVHKLLRLAEAKSQIKIAFALIKPDRLRFLVEKTTEIGVDGLIPILTDRCVVRNINLPKINLYIEGAVEQSHRITVPKVTPLCLLKNLPELYSEEQIIFCNELEKTTSLKELASVTGSKSKIILIGPEGGFTEKERNLLLSLSNVTSIFLTQNILRAETAAIFALSCLI